MIFPNNIGPNLSIDELSVSNGELYTFVTNKEGKCKNGTLVAVINGTRSTKIIEVLEKIDIAKRLTVKEVTLDMAKNMESSVKTAFPEAKLVTDRFHVVKLAVDALQHMRIQLRWNEMDAENNAISKIKTLKKEKEEALNLCSDLDQRKSIEEGFDEKIKALKIIEFQNGDSPKQLLARSRYILTKQRKQWTVSQTERADILFSRYPDLENAYNETLNFRNIYELSNINEASNKLEEWINKVQDRKMKAFFTVANTVKNNINNILNFFENRTTNANAESFNSKVKLFRANLRGVVDTKFFLFRLHKLFS